MLCWCSCPCHAAVCCPGARGLLGGREAAGTLGTHAWGQRVHDQRAVHNHTRRSRARASGHIRGRPAAHDSVGPGQGTSPAPTHVLLEQLQFAACSCHLCSERCPWQRDLPGYVAASMATRLDPPSKPADPGSPTWHAVLTAQATGIIRGKPSAGWKTPPKGGWCRSSYNKSTPPAHEASPCHAAVL